jgi:23S rRNA pseudoU1915 N3-methylase RlmH
MQSKIDRLKSDIEKLGQKIDKNQMDCNAKMKPIMDDERLDEYINQIGDPATMDDETKSLTTEKLAQDLTEDSKYFQLYMQAKFKGIRG